MKITLQTNFVQACLVMNDKHTNMKYMQVHIKNGRTIYEATNGIAAVQLIDDSKDVLVNDGESFKFSFKQLKELVKAKTYTIQATPEEIYGQFNMDSVQATHNTFKNSTEEVAIDLKQLDKIKRAFSYLSKNQPVVMALCGDAIRPIKITPQDNNNLTAFLMPCKI